MRQKGLILGAEELKGAVQRHIYDMEHLLRYHAKKELVKKNNANVRFYNVPVTSTLQA